MIAVVGAVVGWGTAGVAHAGVTTFTMSPSSGTPGTVVHVAGTGCTPGLLASAGTDFVTITATTLDLAFRAPVSANGSWQGTFTVPPGTLGAGALVAAVCVSSSVQSLLTIYTPQTFTVMHDVPPPIAEPGVPGTTVPTEPVVGAPTPTPTLTAPDNGGASGSPATTRPTLGGGISTTLPSVLTIPGVAGRANGDAPELDGSKTDPTVVALAKPQTRTIGAATLEPADLGAALAADHQSTGGLGALGWLLLSALALAVIGTATWFWRSKRNFTVPIPADDAG